MATEHRVAGHLGVAADEYDELDIIAAAGFRRPDCFWRNGLIAVYGAFKGA